MCFSAPSPSSESHRLRATSQLHRGAGTKDRKGDAVTRDCQHHSAAILADDCAPGATELRALKNQPSALRLSHPPPTTRRRRIRLPAKFLTSRSEEHTSEHQSLMRI